MTLKALFYAYLLGGITFIPLVVAGIIFFTIYTSVPVEDAKVTQKRSAKLDAQGGEAYGTMSDNEDTPISAMETDDIPRTRKGWLTMRRTFEETSYDGGYVTIMRSFLDARSKDPKRSRPKDTWYVVLKGTVLYLYEDEEMTECEAAIELGGHEVVIYPEGLLDGELYTKRNAICLKPRKKEEDNLPSVTKEVKVGDDDAVKDEKKTASPKRQEKERNKALEVEKTKQAAKGEALNSSTPWFMFVRSCIEMEDWYLALIHASTQPSKKPTLTPLQPVFLPADMHHLVSTLDEQPDVIPTRWLNALIGRVFFSYYRTHRLEHYIIGRLMKKLSKVKKPTFLTDISVAEVSVGSKAPTLSKPMLKELTKEGDAAMEVHFHYNGEFRITIQATANINIGKSYTVKLVLAAVLKELEGNLLIKIKRPPSSRIWYAFTQAPRMILEVEPIVSDRQLTWSMISSTIEAKLKEIVYESVVLPNMDDIAFFDSSRFIHRGGIWHDASRHEMAAGPLHNAVPVHDSQSVMSKPLPENVVSIFEETPTTQSAEELTFVPVQPIASPSPPPLVETNSAPEAETSDLHPIGKRRPSWFSSVRSEGSTSRKGIFSDPDDEEIDDDPQRGRSKDSDKGSITTFRSRSTPQNSDSPGGRSRDSTPEIDDASPSYLMPQVARRSSSQHSSKREHTKSLSRDSAKSVPDDFEDTKKTSAMNSNSAASFFTALKSRAGDKQALSNTAKEAMRKWGVNWGAKKDSQSGDVSDHVSIGSTISARLRPDPTFSVASKARASYAEVRAAVAERKGRTLVASDDGTDHSSSSSPATLPMSIPESSRGKTRSTSNPRSEFEPLDDDVGGSSSYPESAVLSTSANSTSSSSSKHPFANEVVSHKSSPPLSRTTTEEGAIPVLPSKPIHVVQPTAKTMTIPGIHASHRGEIMSMGYVAPPQPPTMNSSEGKPSIYRLFKTSTGSNSGSGSGSGSGSARPPSPSVQPTLVPQSVTQESSINSVTSNESSKDASHLVPPPPPNIATATTSTAMLGLTSPRVPPPLPPRSPQARLQMGSTLSEAQTALKTIANKDERRRSTSSENVAALSVTSQGGSGVSDSPNIFKVMDADGFVDDHATIPVSDEEPSTSPTPKKPFTPNPNAPPLPPRRPLQTPSEAQAPA